MPNKKALEIAKKLGRPLPTNSVVKPKFKPTTETTKALGTKTMRPLQQNSAKARPAFRPQAFKPPRGA